VLNDAGVKKAHIELCQQGILKGDRCKDVPALPTN
jgi:hypothetical protein